MAAREAEDVAPPKRPRGSGQTSFPLHFVKCYFFRKDKRPGQMSFRQNGKSWQKVQDSKDQTKISTFPRLLAILAARPAAVSTFGLPSFFPYLQEKCGSSQAESQDCQKSSILSKILVKKLSKLAAFETGCPTWAEDERPGEKYGIEKGQWQDFERRWPFKVNQELLAFQYWMDRPTSMAKFRESCFRFGILRTNRRK